MSGGTAVRELDWLLENMAQTVDGVRAAVILSPDGLTLGRSPGLAEAGAEQLAALSAGAASLAHGAAARFGGGDVRQAIFELDTLLMFITPAGRGTSVALLADTEADAGQIAYELSVLVKRVGEHMVANPRFPVRDAI